MKTAKFETGKTYQMTFITDSELRPVHECVKRTEKTATFKDVRDGEMITRKIKTSTSGYEYILLGSYSMAPSISAK